ncbi:MAG: hypothetical protein Q4F84_09775, partial [Fibrobacter sp.]|nr:hypothetical protein [Fibrobacter sp.]
KKYKKAYRDTHAQEYQLHKSSKQTLQEFGIEKLPNPERLQNEIKNLQKEKADATKELHRLQKKLQTLLTVQSNFEELLAGKNVQTALQNEISI